MALMMLMLAACGSDPKKMAGNDSLSGSGDAAIDEPDAHKPDAGSDADTSQDACSVESRAEATFVAEHRACNGDADCVIVGDCGNSEFIAVSTQAEAQAQTLVAARTCRAADGPGYHAVCRSGQCEAVLGTDAVMCGRAPSAHECPSGLSWQAPGCDETASPLVAGCYASCDAGAAAACADGFTCQDANVNPCGEASDGQATCDACGQSVRLCRPSPECELAMHLTLDGELTSRLHQNQATKLEVSVENMSDRPLTFSYDRPCFGADVSGLADYDLWHTCNAGVCEEATTRTTITLAAHEKRVLNSALVTPLSTECNPRGLAVGTYALGFALKGLEGATSCGAGVGELTVVAGQASGS